MQQMSRLMVKRILVENPVCSKPELPGFLSKTDLADIVPRENYECTTFSYQKYGARKTSIKIWVVYRRDLIWNWEDREVIVSDHVLVVGTSLFSKTKWNFVREVEKPVDGPFSVDMEDLVKSSTFINQKKVADPDDDEESED